MQQSLLTWYTCIKNSMISCFINTGLYIFIFTILFNFVNLLCYRRSNWCTLWKQWRGRLHIQWQTNENGAHVFAENPRFSVRIWPSRIRFLYFEDSKRFGWQHIQWYLSVSAFIHYMFIQRITLWHACCKYQDTLYLRCLYMEWDYGLVNC